MSWRRPWLSAQQRWVLHARNIPTGGARPACCAPTGHSVHYALVLDGISKISVENRVKDKAFPFNDDSVIFHVTASSLLQRFAVLLHRFSVAPRDWHVAILTILKTKGNVKNLDYFRAVHGRSFFLSVASTPAFYRMLISHSLTAEWLHWRRKLWVGVTWFIHCCFWSCRCFHTWRNRQVGRMFYRH